MKQFDSSTSREESVGISTSVGAFLMVTVSPWSEPTQSSITDDSRISGSATWRLGMSVIITSQPFFPTTRQRDAPIPCLSTPSDSHEDCSAERQVATPRHDGKRQSLHAFPTKGDMQELLQKQVNCIIVRETEIATFRGIPLFLGVSKKGNNGEMASIRQAQVMSIVR